MNWKEMTPQQKNRFIAEELFGHEIYAAFAPGSETELDYGMLVPDADGTKCIEAIPPYSTDMNTAWLVVQRLKEQEKHLSEQEKYVISRAFLPEQERYDISGAFMQALQTHTYDSWGLPVLSFWNLASLTPERLCYAACRAVGVLDEAGNVQEQEGA